LFSALSDAFHVGPGSQNDVLTAKPDQLGNPQSRLDGHDQEGSVPTADPSGGVWGGDQRIDLLAMEKLDQPALMAFVRHGEHALAEQRMGGLLQGDILKERMDCSQAGIAGARAVAPFLFKMIEELPDEGRIEILESEFRGRRAEAFCSVTQQKTKGVTVTGDGVAAGAALPKQALCEEGFEAEPESFWRS
jgi:hypothetical protein